MIRVLLRICRHPRKRKVEWLFQGFLFSILGVLVLVSLLLYFLSPNPIIKQALSRGQLDQKDHRPSQRVKRGPVYRFLKWEETPVVKLSQASAVEGVSNFCSIYTCFDIHRCRGPELTLYLYPLQRYEVDGGALLPKPSRHFLELLDSLRKWPHLVADPADACILVPAIDTLYLTDEEWRLAASAVKSLPHWGASGENHLVFSFSDNFVGRTGSALVASSNFHTREYRPGFHVPIAFPSPFDAGQGGLLEMGSRKDQYLAVSTENVPLLDEEDSILVLGPCKSKSPFERCKGNRIFRYPEILESTHFCVVYKDVSGPLLWDILRSACIPVFVSPEQRLPFDEVLDWSQFSVSLHEHDLPSLQSILRGISDQKRGRLSAQVSFVFDKYLKDMKTLGGTTLELLRNRVFSWNAKNLQEWNHNPNIEPFLQPLFNPSSSPGENGFTAVVLAYERIASLFDVIKFLVKVPSVSKIIVVWNNPFKKPPPQAEWPPVANKTVKVIQTRANKLSNRFLPFDEIETEAVFSLDDDIVMLTADEVEFAFQTWREYPERIVGFPSRTHVWNNATSQWKYESEWTNQVSMVLTGAAFYHKYWHYAFTHVMPLEIREIVDSTMNCEDIAMNFLVAATTGYPPVKVTPRKKFKCPTCSNNEMLSSDSSHMIERTKCLNDFSRIYGWMPLIPAEFRADPVLFKDKDLLLPARLRKYADIGTI